MFSMICFKLLKLIVVIWNVYNITFFRCVDMKTLNYPTIQLFIEQISLKKKFVTHLFIYLSRYTIYYTYTLFLNIINNNLFLKQYYIY